MSRSPGVPRYSTATLHIVRMTVAKDDRLVRRQATARGMSVSPFLGQIADDALKSREPPRAKLVQRIAVGGRRLRPGTVPTLAGIVRRSGEDRTNSELTGQGFSLGPLSGRVPDVGTGYFNKIVKPSCSKWWSLVRTSLIP